MGQLSGRLKEILRMYGDDPSAHSGALDALAALEQTDPKRAHAIFVQAREDAARRRLITLGAELAEIPFIANPPRSDYDRWPLNEMNDAIKDLETASGHARAILHALDAARTLSASLSRREAHADFTPFEHIRFEALGARAADAEDLRRVIAREAHVQDRVMSAERRARRLDLAAVEVPDLASVAVPDADVASAILDDIEVRLSLAERVEDAHRAVTRELRDPSTKRFARDARKRILKAADVAARHVDRTHAITELGALLLEAEKLRRASADSATAASRARKRGERAPDAPRGSRDMQDYFG